MRVDAHKDTQNSFVRAGTGGVDHERSINPISSVVIGSAPFFGGATVLWILASVIAPEALSSLRPALDVAATHVGTAFGAYTTFLGVVAQSLQWNHWQTYMLLYVVLSVSTHLAPSIVDLRHAFVGAAVLIIFASLLWITATHFHWNIPFNVGMVTSSIGTFVSVFLTLGIIVSGTVTLVLQLVLGLVSMAFHYSRKRHS